MTDVTLANEQLTIGALSPTCAPRASGGALPGLPEPAAGASPHRRPRSSRNPNRWQQSVQYRWACEGGCGELRQVAVIRLRDGSRLRLCQDCYLDGWW